MNKKFIAYMLIFCVMCAAACASDGEAADGSSDVSESNSEFYDIDPEESESETVDEGYSPDFTFSTTDRDGNFYDESFFAQYELTMINMFEPWCGPCVGEMGDIELLYEEYASSGFQVIGLYSDTTMESTVDEIISYTGLTYPLLYFTDDFARFQTGYVPTTIFVNSEGHIVTTDNPLYPQYVGARDYEEWESIVLHLLR